MLLRIKDGFSKQLLFSFEAMLLYGKSNATMELITRFVRSVGKDKFEEVMIDMCKIKNNTLKICGIGVSYLG